MSSPPHMIHRLKAETFSLAWACFCLSLTEILQLLPISERRQHLSLRGRSPFLFLSKAKRQLVLIQFCPFCECLHAVFPSDITGNVIDLVKDTLPELQLSEEDRQKNLELLEQAKKVSDRFLTRRGRRSTGSLSESPTGDALKNINKIKPILGCSFCVVTQLSAASTLKQVWMWFLFSARRCEAVLPLCCTASRSE